MKYFVYIILCENESLYTGITTDIDRRFKEHTEGKGGAYTRANKPVTILYAEKVQNRSTALKREAQIKSLSRKEKLSLIKEGNNQT